MHVVGPAGGAKSGLGVGNVGGKAFLGAVDRAVDGPVGAVEGQRARIEQGQHLKSLGGEPREVLRRSIGRIGGVGGKVRDLGMERRADRLVRYEATEGGLARIGLCGRPDEGIGNRRMELGGHEAQTLRRALGDHSERRLEVGNCAGAAAQAERRALELKAALAQMGERREAEIEPRFEAIGRPAPKADFAGIGAGKRGELVVGGGIGDKAGKHQLVASLVDAEREIGDAWRLEGRGAAEIGDGGGDLIGDRAGRGRPREGNGAIVDFDLAAFEQEQSPHQSQSGSGKL